MNRHVLALALFAPLAAQAQSPASFLVVHGIPGRDVGPKLDPLLPVDVQVGSLCLLQNFTFGQIAGPYDVPAGSYPVAISLANPLMPCTNSPVISATVTLKSGEFGAVVAALSTAGAPAADVFPIDVSALPAGQQRFSILHAADAPTATINAKSTGGGSLETVKVTVKPGKEQQTFVFTRSGYAITASVSGATVGPFNVQLGDRGLLVGVAVGSAKSGSLTLLTKTVPSL